MIKNFFLKKQTTSSLLLNGGLLEVTSRSTVLLLLLLTGTACQFKRYFEKFQVTFCAKIIKNVSLIALSDQVRVTYNCLLF